MDFTATPNELQRQFKENPYFFVALFAILQGILHNFHHNFQFQEAHHVCCSGNHRIFIPSAKRVIYLFVLYPSARIQNHLDKDILTH